MTAHHQLPAILCLHGRGTSALIFQIQTIQLRRLLEDRFDFMFCDAPFICAPGPNVLPVFEDEGPYYAWTKSMSTDVTSSQEFRATIALLDKIESENRPIAGVLGFSQGTTAGLGLLLRDQRRRQRGAFSIGYRFGVFVGGSTAPLVLEEVAGNLGSRSKGDDAEYLRDILKIPTIHARGKDDQWARTGELAQQKHCSKQSISVLEYEGGHEMPRTIGDTARLADMIVQAYGAEESRECTPEI
jgi:pimeloyl-ACP methyl ester carboxylesterase